MTTAGRCAQRRASRDGGRAGAARARRRADRGQTLAFVAVGFVALLAVTGLALDAGYEAANFRTAHNAADAGALAGARYLYAEEMAGRTPTIAQVQGVVDEVIEQNHANPGQVSIVHTDGTRGAAAHLAAARSAGGLALPAALMATPPACSPYCLTSTTATSALGIVSVPPSNRTVQLSISTASTGTALGHSTASALTEVAYVNLPPLPAQNPLCERDTWTYAGGRTGPVSCGALGGSTYGSLGSQFPYAGGDTATDIGIASTVQTTVNAASGAVTGTVLQVAATGTQEIDSVAPGRGQTTVVTSEVRITNLTVTLAVGVTMTSALIDYTQTAVVSPGVGGNPPTITMQALRCVPTTLTFTGVGSVPVSATCAVSLPSIVGVTLTANSTTATPSPCTGLSCSTTSCFVYANIPDGSGGSLSNACVGQASSSLSVTGPSTAPVPTPTPWTPGPNCTSTPCGTGKPPQGCVGTCSLISPSPAGGGGATPTPTPGGGGGATPTPTPGGGGGATPTPTPAPCTGTCNPSVVFVTPESVVVEAYVPTPNFFLGVLGWFGTRPTATATAQILTVADVGAAASAASPYAIPDTGVQMDAPGSVRFLLSPDAQGHVFYLYGSQMTTDYATVAGFPAGWQGQVQSSGSHKVGSTLVGVNGSGSGPVPYATGTSYYVLPIISSAGVVEAYGVFLKQATAGWGKLVNSVPALKGPVITGNSDPALDPWLPGASESAVTIELTS